jgi:hypothetical protein
MCDTAGQLVCVAVKGLAHLKTGIVVTMHVPTKRNVAGSARSRHSSGRIAHPQHSSSQAT